MNEPAAPACCGTCACYVPDPMQIGLGTCRCLPPVPIAASQNGVPGLIAIFPPVPAGGYCHQWRAQARAVDASDSLVSQPTQEPERGT